MVSGCSGHAFINHCSRIRLADLRGSLSSGCHQTTTSRAGGILGAAAASRTDCIVGEMKGMVSAFTAIASSPEISVPTEHVAADAAASLMTVLLAMLVSAPTYF